MILDDVQDLSKGSHKKVNVSCDVCGIEKQIAYRDYLKSYNNYGYYTCNKCSFVKNKRTNLEKYGDENYYNIDKFKETSMKKFGVENPFQSEEIKNKIKIKNFKEYGVEHNSQIKSVKDKIKYSIENKSEKDKQTTINNRKMTMFSKFGVEHPSQNNEIMNKTIKNALKTREKTLIEKYPFIKYVDYENKLIKAVCDYGHQYEIPMTLFYVRKSNNNVICLVRNPFKTLSTGEKLIKKYLEENNINFVSQKTFNECKNKKYLPFDFYLPDYNTCIEYDGRQHFNINTIYYTDDIKINDEIKTEFCKNNNINLIRIHYKDDVLNKLNKITF